MIFRVKPIINKKTKQILIALPKKKIPIFKKYTPTSIRLKIESMDFKERKDNGL